MTSKLYRHKKRGTIYKVVGHAKFQVSNDIEVELVADYKELVVYRDKDGQLWIRDPKGFYDPDRFEELKD